MNGTDLISSLPSRTWGPDDSWYALREKTPWVIQVICISGTLATPDSTAQTHTHRDTFLNSLSATFHVSCPSDELIFVYPPFFFLLFRGNHSFIHILLWKHRKVCLDCLHFRSVRQTSVILILKVFLEAPGFVSWDTVFFLSLHPFSITTSPALMVVAGAGACPSCRRLKDGGYTLDTPTAYPSLSPLRPIFFPIPLTSVCSDCDRKLENRTHVDIRKGHRLRHRTRNLLARRRQCYPRRLRVSQTRKTYHISW